MFATRRGRRATRFTPWKLALLFLGAGIWLAGVTMENFQVTGAAILVIVIALLLGLVERARPSEEPGEDRHP